MDRPHVAIVMDGNGRWATRRGLPRASGHGAGVGAIERTVEAAMVQGIGILTVYAFSSDNWRRPQAEIETLMGLLRTYVVKERERLRDEGVRLEVIGRRDRLPEGLKEGIEAAETATSNGKRLTFRVAVDYSSRDAILSAATTSLADREAFAKALGSPDVDLLIRTGGERRLSDFMLWECAYAELHFTDVAWPDFDAATLAAAMADFDGRQRRFGALPTLEGFAA